MCAIIRCRCVPAVGIVLCGVGVSFVLGGRRLVAGFYAGGHYLHHGRFVIVLTFLFFHRMVLFLSALSLQRAFHTIKERHETYALMSVFCQVLPNNFEGTNQKETYLTPEDMLEA